MIDWGESRLFFYRRLKRRIAEESLIHEVRKVGGPEFLHADALALIQKAYLETRGPNVQEDWTDDSAFMAWSKNPRGLDLHLEDLQIRHVTKQLMSLGTSAQDMKALPHGLSALLHSVSHPVEMSFKKSKGIRVRLGGWVPSSINCHKLNGSHCCHLNSYLSYF